MASKVGPTDGAAQDPLRVRLLAEQPDLVIHVDAEHREQARATVTAPVLAVAAGPWDHAMVGANSPHAFGAIVLSGLMARTLDIGNHPSLELYGPGEQQHDRLGLQLVIAEQPRVEDRLLALFWLLSERFGRVTADGVVVALSTTHEALGRLIGAQRPTVTIALRALRERGAVLRRPGGGWLLAAPSDDTVIDPAPLPSGHAPIPVDGAVSGDGDGRSAAGTAQLRRAAAAALRKR